MSIAICSFVTASMESCANTGEVNTRWRLVKKKHVNIGMNVICASMGIDVIIR